MALLAALLAPGPAAADDRRPCVSLEEVNAAPALTYPRVEALWEVKPLNVVSPWDPRNPNLVARVYKACAYDIDELLIVGTYRASNKQAQYYMRLWQVVPVPDPHGHERIPARAPQG